MRVLAAAVLVAAGLAGCAGASDELAQFAVCDYLYPDDTPVDCSRDDAGPFLASVPSDATCIDQTVGWADDDSGARLWRRADGHVWVEVKVPEAPGVNLGIVTAEAEGKQLAVLARGEAGGFVDVGNLGDADAIRFTARFYQVEAQADGQLDGATITTRLTRFEESPWTLVVATQGDKAYVFSPMIGQTFTEGTSYSPSNFVFDPPGFRLAVNVTRGIAAQGSSVVPPAPLLPLGPTSSRCD